MTPDGFARAPVDAYEHPSAESSRIDVILDGNSPILKDVDCNPLSIPFTDFPQAAFPMRFYAGHATT
jgi:hypothetical protein